MSNIIFDFDEVTPEFAEEYVWFVYGFLRRFCERTVEIGKCTACPYRVKNKQGKYVCVWSAGVKPFMFPAVESLEKLS